MMKPQIRACAVQLWSRMEATPEDNRRHAIEMLEQAAADRPDLIVLPEAVSMLCYPDGRPGFTYRDVAESIPGPTTEAVSRIARNSGSNVVIGLIEDHGPGKPCQNVALVFDRRGALIGRYEKTHEPEVCRTEQEAGLGEVLPVFDLDFGRIGVFICWDLLAPEVATILALKGAQLLCFPHLIALPSQRNFAISLRARAVDNALPIVAAGMRDAHNHNGSQDGLFPTCILDADGAVVAQSEESGPSIVAASLRLGPVRVDHLGVARNRVDWNAQRSLELRPDLYAREFEALDRYISPEL